MPFLKISCIIGTIKHSDLPSSSKTTHVSNLLYYSSIIYIIAVGASLRYMESIYIYIFFLSTMILLSCMFSIITYYIYVNSIKIGNQLLRE